MAAIDIDQLVTDIKNAANKIINKDIATVKGFSERQLKAIGQHAALVAGGIVTGQITDETREFFLDGIENMTQNFLETLQGLFRLTVEKLWNAVVGVVWGAINGAISAATGLVLPVPTKV
ncbi:hypothetical protein D3879_10045 [Pseudomonas cavernicola]|uniref:Uncharacterized protein n=1 Tax=Pseudomonas cavernicola TaxID=2320866 RepID=A0A418XM94_9PSED|nr:hypothetical protein [Pseudomonas cavernicola]RJG13556.1 hypothetical protein D3879_10045 [Pseudomonas cavernicola]